MNVKEANYLIQNYIIRKMIEDDVDEIFYLINHHETDRIWSLYMGNNFVTSLFEGDGDVEKLATKYIKRNFMYQSRLIDNFLLINMDEENYNDFVDCCNY